MHDGKRAVRETMYVVCLEIQPRMSEGVHDRARTPVRLLASVTSVLTLHSEHRMRNQKPLIMQLVTALPVSRAECAHVPRRLTPGPVL